MSDSCVIRSYRPEDRPDVLALHETVFGDGHGPEWFAWKFENNPYIDHVPIIVAEHDGDIVGARPLMALPMTIQGETVLGLQTTDLMVHPNYRRNGLFTEMVAVATDRYRRHDAAFLFSFPNRRALSGYDEFGWTTVGRVPTYYRVQRPSALIQSSSGLSDGLLTVAPTALSALDSMRTLVSPATTSVKRIDQMPVELLASLYRSYVPNRIHAHRDGTFYNWRFDNPVWDYETYVAQQGDSTTAAAIVGKTLKEGVKIVAITDLVPSPPKECESVGAILETVVSDNSEADLLIAGSSVLTSTLAGRYGFLADSSLPLSPVTNTSVLIATLLDRDSGPATGLGDINKWLVGLTEQDTF